MLGRETQINTLPIVEGQSPTQIARRAIEAAKLGAYDVVMLDTAGRTTLDDAMMSEATEVKNAVNPHEVLLVADALTGQDAVNLARSFDERVGLSGIVLTRVDGDGRGGAALSMRAVTGKPIKLIGTGEKLDALEEFDPARIAGRILGMGDIVALVEKAAANIDAEKAMRTAEKMRKGAFDLGDLREQLTQMQGMGGLGGLMGLKGGEKVSDIKLDRVFIGSCTNSRIEDLREVARVVAGKHVNANVNAMIVPGSGLVKIQAEAEGLDKIFKAAGFEWREPGCSMCLAMRYPSISFSRLVRR